MIDGLAGVILWTDNLEEMAAFYQNVLGLKPHSVRSNFVAFRWGDVRLSLGRHSKVKGKTRDPYRMMVNLSTRDIYTEHQRLARLGVPFLRPPEREHWGGWVATLTDPDGNILQLLQQPDSAG